MKKNSLLLKLEQIENDAELKEVDQGTMMQVMLSLLAYINDRDIQEAVDRIPM